MKTLLLVAALALATAPLAAQAKKPGGLQAKLQAAAGIVTLTGWVTDSHCGAGGANAAHNAAALEKCLRAGARLQFRTDDGKTYFLDSFEKVKGVAGKRVKLAGALNASTNTIAVGSVQPQ